MSESPSAKERAHTAAGTAVDDSKQVAGTAAEEARAVASEAAGHARRLVDDAIGQVSEQSRVQQDRLAGTVSTLADDLGRMAEQGEPGLAQDLTRELADRARAVGSRLEGREPRELLEDVRGFARRRPGVFLLGSLAAGVVAGRLLRGAADGIAAAEAGAGSGTGSASDTAPGGTGGTPPPLPSAPAVEPLPAVSEDDAVLGGTPPVPPGGPVSAPQTAATGSGPEMGYGERGPGEPSGERGAS